MFPSITESIPRRLALTLGAVILGGAALILLRPSTQDSAGAAEVMLVEFDDRGQRVGRRMRKKVIRSDSEWRRLLTAQQYWSARRGTTDSPFTGTYYQVETAGLFRCVCCRNALFQSEAKFDSGTGWPSFSSPIADENIWTRTDKSLAEPRVEVLCRLCDAHLGHIFDDGPPPAGLRYCINESALVFVATMSQK